MTDTPRRHPLRRWFRSGDLGRALVSLVGAVLGLVLAAWLVPDFALGGWQQAISVAFFVLVFGALLRPVLVHVSVWLGWVGTVLIGLFAQAIILWAVVTLTDTGEPISWWSALLASWVVAAVATLFSWVATAGTDDAVTAGLVRTAHRSKLVIPDADVPGIVFVQADGVPFPVLNWSVRAGTTPTMSRWVRDGTHRLVEWRPKLPATTPASQMGILHGTIDGIPAFRWVDRAEGRVYVANKPADAAAIEARHSDGHGLLVDDGVSISNLFTGDAPTAYATMSAVDRTRETKQTRVTLSGFLTRPDGLARSLSRTFSEIARERFQASRARQRDVRPRAHRGWDFTFERAALSGVMRDLNTTLVADSMLRGRRAVYVDYVDYDAVAHHAGIMQPESLAALEGIDAVLAQLEEVAAVAPRRYLFVVLSDHGQSQGEVFADRYGEDLKSLVHRLSEAQAYAADHNAEGSGSLNSMIASSSSTDTVMGRAFGRASDKMTSQKFGSADEAAEVERGQLPAADGGAPTGDEDRFLVFGSGNLGLIYVAGSNRRLTREDLDTRFPALVAGLAGHPGIGFTVVETVEHGPVAFGARGEHRVRSGEVVGEDPLAPYGPDAPQFVLRAASMPEAPDIYVNSLLDELGEVAAFEGLVGCHGGLGGWQDRASLLWPVELPKPGPAEAPDGMVVGADAMHRVLVGWLEHLGHRGPGREGAPARAVDQDAPGVDVG